MSFVDNSEWTDLMVTLLRIRMVNDRNWKLVPEKKWGKKSVIKMIALMNLSQMDFVDSYLFVSLGLHVIPGLIFFSSDGGLPN